MTTARPRVLILGGGYAGLLAAARLSRSKRPLDITLVDARARFEQRIRYHEALAGGRPKTLALEPALRRRGIHFRPGRVERIATTSRQVTVRDDTGCGRIGYDYLVLALGSQVGAPVPGVSDHAWRPVSQDDTERLNADIERLERLGAHIAVVGGGLTALEIATELKDRHPSLAISLVSRSPLGADWSDAARRHIGSTLDRLGIRLYEHHTVTGVADGELMCEEGDRIGMDRCVWAAGFSPSSLAIEAGLPTDSQGRVLTDDRLRVVGQDRVFVAGDSARAGGGRTEALRMGCSTAMPQGAHVGDNLRSLLNGEPMQPFRFGYFFRCVSLGRNEGLIQYTDPHDRPIERIHRGRLAVWIKESICRMTYWAVKWELITGWRLYRWPGPSSAQASNTTTRVDSAPSESEQ